MDALSFKNFRCFDDISKVDIKKLNILIGTNSSGKSSFLRFFPLLRQSMETETKGPILWYDKYVDFGTFENAIYRGADSDEIVFGFHFKECSFIGVEKMFQWNDFSGEGVERPNFCIRVFLKKRKKSWQTYIPKFECEIGWGDGEKDLIEFDLNEDELKEAKVVINGERFSVSTLVDQNNIIPLVRPKDLQSEVDFPHGYYYAFPSDYLKVINAISGMVKWERVIKSVRAMKPMSKTRFIKNARKVFAIGAGAQEQFEDLHRVWLINYLSQALFVIRRSVELVAQNVHYITPTRANAERFYRLRDLQVNQVDFDGKNLAIFLNALSDTKKAEFSKWSQENFGINIKAKEKDGQLSIYVNDEKTLTDENVIDTGFGYSQVLPIIAALWIEMSSKIPRVKGSGFWARNVNVPRIFVIEQPELHLHPKLQSKLGMIFANSIRVAAENEIDLRLIIETHSQTLINRMARIVSAPGSGLVDDFQILIFDKNVKSTIISKASINKNGLVENWPYGFFEEDDIKIESHGDF